MKTIKKSSAKLPPLPPIPAYLSATEKAFVASADRYWEKLARLSKAKQRAALIKLGALTPDGKVTVYPMDHVPLGPRE